MKINSRIVATSLYILVMCVVIFMTIDLPMVAKITPLLVGTMGIILGSVQLTTEVRRIVKGEVAQEDILDQTSSSGVSVGLFYKKSMIFIGWLLAFYAMLWLFGLAIGFPVFFAAYARLNGRSPWLTILAVIAVAVFLMVYLVNVVHVQLPEGRYGELLELPIKAVLSYFTGG